MYTLNISLMGFNAPGAAILLWHSHMKELEALFHLDEETFAEEPNIDPGKLDGIIETNKHTQVWDQFLELYKMREGLIQGQQNMPEDWQIHFSMR